MLSCIESCNLTSPHLTSPHFTSHPFNSPHLTYFILSHLISFHRRLTKNTAYILRNSSSSLTDFDGQLMGLILHKGSSSNSDHYISVVNVGGKWFKCDDVKITQIVFYHFCNSNTVYMLFYKRRARWKHLRGIGLVPMDASC